MDTTTLRRKDTTKGPPLRVLSLDGGGIRGYSMLIILQELMYRTYVECEGKAPRRDQIPKPCDHFDLIAGTGTGGLIALMLGRLRLDLETCKDVYVRMTRRVFETDKTIAGIPYRSTLFKASKLEEAIRQCVREHTTYESEGNDGSPSIGTGYIPSSFSTTTLGPQRRLSRASVSTTGTSNLTSPVSNRGSISTNRPIWGNPNAKLYDNRENRTKTAVTAVYKGTPKNGSSAFLRSYDSRKEPPPEFNCTVWQAGRATCATGLAFKPIQIGQHVFIDEGVGKYNPAPQVLDEAVVNEWPGRELGVFVSVGTGKRPAGTSHIQHEWWEDFFADSLGGFAEARRRLISKIEGCEAIHQHMLKEYLARRNVQKDNYYRLNVEVGVGEFGMNEWSRLADISTSTRTYLAKSDVQRLTLDASVKLAKIQRTHRRIQLHSAAASSDDTENHNDQPLSPARTATKQPSMPTAPPPPPPPPPPPRDVFELPAIELPADDAYSPSQHSPLRLPSQDKYIVTSSGDHPEPLNIPRKGSSHGNRPHTSPSPGQHNLDQNSQINPRYDSPRVSSDTFRPDIPPPLPPKTPMPYPENNNSTTATGQTGVHSMVAMPIPPRSANRPLITNNSQSKFKLPYPDDGPPPLVNRHRKPTYNSR